MNKKLKTIIIILSSIIFSAGIAVGAFFFAIYNMDDWGYSIDNYNGTYSGKIDSYLDVKYLECCNPQRNEYRQGVWIR